MRVDVESPCIAGDTVVFRWTQSEPNPFQYENGFSLRYEGLDLGQFSAGFLYEVFLGLQLKVFTAYGRAVEVTFPEPVPASSAAFWKTYHGADRVSIVPIAEDASYDPWQAPRPPARRHRTAGVFFGGGKDSMLAACLLSEFVGPDEVVLFQFVHPFRRGKRERDRITKRQEILMLRPVRETLGVATQRAWTDYLANLRLKSAGRRVRPHLELYTLGFLPVLLDWGVSVCTAGLERTIYRARRSEDGQLSFNYPNARPEVLAALSRHYRRALGADVSVTDVNLLFTSLMAVRLLVERYPDAFQHIVMCGSAPGAKRWCHDCKKCVEYAFYSLCCGVVDPDFDYDAFFARSRYVEKIVAYLQSGVELSVFGNAPWQRFFSHPAYYLGFCHAIAQIDPALLRGKIGDTALANLFVLKALFGNRLFPSYELLSTRSRDFLGSDLARAIARIAGEHFPTVDELPGPVMAGKHEVVYDFDLRMPTPLDSLDHIRS
jgi:hypothetical protein